MKPVDNISMKVQGSQRINVKHLLKEIVKNKYIYIMILPVIAHYIVFHYLPLYGVVIAFKDFRAGLGIMGSPWVGFKYFEQFFNSYYCWRLIRNTLLINLYGLIFVFPAPIILALLLNELRSNKYKRLVQTISYLPHFISIVVVVGFIKTFFAYDGLVSNLFTAIGLKSPNFLLDPNWFRPLYLGSAIWQGIGWGSITYLAAITGIDPMLYAAATIDGAGRFRKIISITLPSIAPTIIILLIFRIGGMMSVGFEKVFLMYNASVYETADVISTFVYRSGLQQVQYSYSAAIGLFNNVINFILIIISNYISRVVSETSLW